MSDDKNPTTGLWIMDIIQMVLTALVAAATVYAARRIAWSIDTKSGVRDC